MSHGPGRVQKYILDQVAEQGYCLLKEVPAPQPSASRAVQKLEAQGLVSVWWFLMGFPDERATFGRADRRTVAAFRPGISQAEFQALREENGLLPGRESRGPRA